MVSIPGSSSSQPPSQTSGHPPHSPSKWICSRNQEEKKHIHQSLPPMSFGQTPVLLPKAPSTSSEGIWTLQTHPKHLPRRYDWRPRGYPSQNPSNSRAFSTTEDLSFTPVRSVGPSGMVIGAQRAAAGHRRHRLFGGGKGRHTDLRFGSVELARGRKEGGGFSMGSGSRSVRSVNSLAEVVRGGTMVLGGTTGSKRRVMHKDPEISPM